MLIIGVLVGYMIHLYRRKLLSIADKPWASKSDKFVEVAKQNNIGQMSILLKKEARMKPNKAPYVVMIILCVFTLFSCSQKFPKPISKEEGVLVIAHKATNETQFDFGFKYELKYLPEASVKIKIKPSIKSDFIMVDHFPVGEYWITGVTTLPDHSGTTIPMSLRNEKTINGDSFEIKPKHITLLNSKFVVINSMRTDSGTVQSWKLEKLDDKSRNELVNNLKILENSKLWSFSD